MLRNNHKIQWMGAYILLGILGSLIVILVAFLWLLFSPSNASRHTEEEVEILENNEPNTIIENPTPILDLFKEQKYPGVPATFDLLTFGMSREEIKRLPLGPPPWKVPHHPEVSFIPEFSKDLFTGLKFETSSRLPPAEKLETILGPPKHRVHVTFFNNRITEFSNKPRLVWFTPNPDPNSTKPDTCFTYDTDGLRWHYCKTAASWFPSQWDKAPSSTCSFAAKADKLGSQLQKCQSFVKIDKNRFLIPPVPGLRSAMVATLYLGAKQELRSFEIKFPYSDEFSPKRTILTQLKDNFSTPKSMETWSKETSKVFIEEEDENLIFTSKKMGESPVRGLKTLERVGKKSIIESLWPHRKTTTGPRLPQGVPSDLYLNINKLPTLNFEPPDQWKSWGIKWGKIDTYESSRGPFRFSLYLPVSGLHTHFEKLWGVPRWVEREKDSSSISKRIWLNNDLGFMVSVQDKFDYQEPDLHGKNRPSTFLHFGRYTPLKTLIGNPEKAGHLGFEPQDLMGLTYQEIIKLFPPGSISYFGMKNDPNGYADLYLPATEGNSEFFTTIHLTFSDGTLKYIDWSSSDISEEHFYDILDQYLESFGTQMKLEKKFNNAYIMKTPSRHYSLVHTEEDIIVFVTKNK